MRAPLVVLSLMASAAVWGSSSGATPLAAECSAIVPLDAFAAPPPPVPGPCQGIRPGSQMANGCTLNWVWEATTDGDRDLYVGTAGHCIGLGQRAVLATGDEFGTAVFSRASGVGNDFGLIHVDEEREGDVNPHLCHWGGPLKAFHEASGVERAERVVYHYGNGAHTQGSDLLKPRLGLAVPFDGAVTFVGQLSGGDSGSPVMLRNGLAWGVATHAAIVDPGIPGAPLPGPAGFGIGVGGAELKVWLELGLDLELVTAPLA